MVAASARRGQCGRARSATGELSQGAAHPPGEIRHGRAQLGRQRGARGGNGGDLAGSEDGRGGGAEDLGDFGGCHGTRLRPMVQAAVAPGERRRWRAAEGSYGPGGHVSSSSHDLLLLPRAHGSQLPPPDARGMRETAAGLPPLRDGNVYTWRFFRCGKGYRWR
jgi:hypothetical protein